MRLMSLMAPLVLALVACGTDSDTDIDPDDTDVGTETETEDDGEFHPLVPEEFKYLWITDTPCEKRGGRPGKRVYKLLTEGRVLPDGTLTATEKWFFFSGDPERWDEDTVDTLSYSGVQSDTIDGASLDCVSCEEVYELERSEVENNSGTGYSNSVVFALDTLNFNGDFNEDKKMQVMYARRRNGELTDLNTDYARGHMYPDDDKPGSRPASFDWVGETCF